MQFMTHDLFVAMSHLITEARRFSPSDGKGPVPTAKAAVAFTIQLAIDNGHDAVALRQLEKQLMAILED